MPTEKSGKLYLAVGQRHLGSLVFIDGEITRSHLVPDSQYGAKLAEEYYQKGKISKEERDNFLWELHKSGIPSFSEIMFRLLDAINEEAKPLRRLKKNRPPIH